MSSHCPRPLLRTVIGPLEALFELGDELGLIAGHFRKAIRLPGLLIFFLIIGTIPVTYEVFNFLYDYAIGAATSPTQGWPWLVAAFPSLILVLALAVTSLLFIFQIFRLTRVFGARHDIINKMEGSGDLPEGFKASESKKSPKKESSEEKHPLGFSGLVEEAAGQLPHLGNLLRLVRMMLALFLIFTILDILAYLASTSHLLFLGVGDIIYIPLILITSGLLFAAVWGIGCPIAELKRLGSRHGLIRAVLGPFPLEVPEGLNAASRLETYLTAVDPFVARNKDKVVHNKAGFDILLEADLLERLSTFLPAKKYGIYVKLYSQVPSRKQLESLLKAAAKRAKVSETTPLRICALVDLQDLDAPDIPDDLTEFLYDAGIKNTHFMAPLQLVVEDGRIYSFTPIVAYEV